MLPETISQIADYVLAEQILNFDFETPRPSGTRKVKRPHFINEEKLRQDQYLNAVPPTFLKFKLTPKQILKAVERNPFGIFMNR